MGLTNVKIFHPGDPITVREIAGTIDHSLLRPDITSAELVEGCALARRVPLRLRVRPAPRTCPS